MHYIDCEQLHVVRISFARYPHNPQSAFDHSSDNRRLDEWVRTDRIKGLTDDAAADSAADDGAAGGRGTRKRPRATAVPSSDDGVVAVEAVAGIGHGDMDPATAALEREHEEITKVRQA